MAILNLCAFVEFFKAILQLFIRKAESMEEADAIEEMLDPEYDNRAGHGSVSPSRHSWYEPVVHAGGHPCNRASACSTRCSQYSVSNQTHESGSPSPSHSPAPGLLSLQPNGQSDSPSLTPGVQPLMPNRLSYHPNPSQNSSSPSLINLRHGQYLNSQGSGSPSLLNFRNSQDLNEPGSSVFLSVKQSWSPKLNQKPGTPIFLPHSLSQCSTHSLKPSSSLPSPKLVPSWYHLQNSSFAEFIGPRKPPSISPLTDVLKLCDQIQVLTFSDIISADMMSTVVKLGEGGYGEVFQAEIPGLTLAIKIVPVDGPIPINEDMQKTMKEIIPEILITLELSNLRQRHLHETENFVPVHKVSLVKGNYPVKMLKEWDNYSQSKGTENDKPDFLGPSQHYIVYQLYDCGIDLEKYECKSTAEACTILLQVAYAIAVAEKALQFEHRDVHWGNVLINSTSEEFITFRLAGQNVCLPSYGIQAFIIDFTLSRLTKDGIDVYSDLSKEHDLFTGKGDYQFDIYRKMKVETENKWNGFHPKTNVFWMHYLTYKLLNCKIYKSKRDSLKVQMLNLMKEISAYDSVEELVCGCTFFNKYLIS